MFPQLNISKKLLFCKAFQKGQFTSNKKPENMVFQKLCLLAFVLSTSGLAPPPLVAWRFGHSNGVKRGSMKSTTFRFRYLTRFGKCLYTKPTHEYSIRIAATNEVYENAIEVACKTLSKITMYMPKEVFRNVSKSRGVGIFTMLETLSVYPQNRELADRKECYQTCENRCNHTCTFDGRKYSDVAGLTNSISLSNMESILCLPTDIYQGAENILTHEFAHLVHMNLNNEWKQKILTAYNDAQGKDIWYENSYAMENEYEYFAVAAESFFNGVNRSDIKSTGGMNMCTSKAICSSEINAREFLLRQDPPLFYSLSYAFTDDRPWLTSGLQPCVKVDKYINW